jgi:hypothetical protein
MVAVDVVIIEVLSCNNASMRYIFKGEKSANPPARARTKYPLAINLKTRQSAWRSRNNRHALLGCSVITLND